MGCSWQCSELKISSIKEYVTECTVRKATQIFGDGIYIIFCKRLTGLHEHFMSKATVLSMFGSNSGSCPNSPSRCLCCRPCVPVAYWRLSQSWRRTLLSTHIVACKYHRTHITCWVQFAVNHQLHVSMFGELNQTPRLQSHVITSGSLEEYTIVCFSMWLFVSGMVHCIVPLG